MLVLLGSGVIFFNYTRLQWANAAHCAIVQHRDRDDHDMSPNNTYVSYNSAVVSDNAQASDLDSTQGPQRTLKKRLPSVILIGAMKAGTTALMTFLRLHPDIVTLGGEENFFSNNYHKGLAWYREQMPKSASGQVTLVKTAGYLYNSRVPERIHAFNSSIKLLLILRHPVERVLSWYAHDTHKAINRNLEKHTFNEAIFELNSSKINEFAIPIKTSRYGDFLPMWLERFSREQLLILDGDKFITDPFVALNEVEKFLGLRTFYKRNMLWYNESKGFFCFKNENKEFCMGDNKGREHQQLSNELREKLLNYFKNYNEKLNTIAGTNFHWNV